MNRSCDLSRTEEVKSVETLLHVSSPLQIFVFLHLVPSRCFSSTSESLIKLFSLRKFRWDAGHIPKMAMTSSSWITSSDPDTTKHRVSTLSPAWKIRSPGAQWVVWNSTASERRQPSLANRKAGCSLNTWGGGGGSEGRRQDENQTDNLCLQEPFWENLMKTTRLLSWRPEAKFKRLKPLLRRLRVGLCRPFLRLIQRFCVSVNGLKLQHKVTEAFEVWVQNPPKSSNVTLLKRLKAASLLGINKKEEGKTASDGRVFGCSVKNHITFCRFHVHR